jgi:hypothetical protein
MSFDMQVMKVSNEINIDIFANGLFMGFKMGFRQNRQSSSSHLDNNDKKV